MKSHKGRCTKTQSSDGVTLVIISFSVSQKIEDMMHSDHWFVVISRHAIPLDTPLRINENVLIKLCIHKITGVGKMKPISINIQHKLRSFFYLFRN